MNILIVATPNGGKDTQHKLLRKEFPYKYVSSGDILRKIAEEDSEIGVAVKRIIAAGDYVPKDVFDTDAAVNDILRNFRGHKVLNGYPRTIPQSDEFLNEYGIEGTVVVVLDIEDEECIRRSEKRKRNDDEKIQKRLKEYKDQTLPMIFHMEQRGVQIKYIDASGPQETVFAELVEFLRPYIG